MPKQKIKGPNFLKYQSEDGSRIVTAIGAYPFYQSTGRNSKHPGTYFPFMGVLEKPVGFQPQGWLIKPEIKDTLSSYYPKNIIDYCQDTALLERFGNLEAMLISALINQGFWQTKRGIEWGAHLRKCYPGYLNSMGKTYHAFFVALKQTENSMVKTEASPKKINLFLEKALLKDIFKRGKIPRYNYNFKLTAPVQEKHCKNAAYVPFSAIKGSVRSKLYFFKCSQGDFEIYYAISPKLS